MGRSMLFKASFVKGWVFLFSAGLLFNMITAQPLRAETFIIDNGDVTGLINSIDAANNEVDYPGLDIIKLATDGTYTLTTVHTTGEGATGLPTITSAISINGNGSTIERSTDSNTPIFRIFHVSTGGNLALDHVRVQNGIADDGGTGGGGILNHGTLDITNSVLSGNSAFDGGGIYNLDGEVIINGSTLNKNTAYNGGGVYNTGGDLTITNSTFSENSGYNEDGKGGGIFNLTDGMIRVTNSTFVGNSAFEGGGISIDSASMEIKNSIIANSLSGSDCFNSGTFLTFGTNFDTDGSCPDFITVVAEELNLGILKDYGCFTGTHALLPGSVAIDAATDCTLLDGITPLTEDQCGRIRPIDFDFDGISLCDVGAYEALDPDIGIKKEVDTNNPNVGDTICYTITLRTDPNTAYEGVIVVDKLPEGVAYDPNKVTGPGTYDPVTGYWDVNAIIYADSSVSLKICVTVKDLTDPKNNKITNTATIVLWDDPDTSEYEEDFSNNEDFADITVNPENTPPVAYNDPYPTDEDTFLTVPAPGVLGNDDDEDPNTLTAVKKSDPNHGTLLAFDPNDGSFQYKPDQNYSGPDSFTYSAKDSHQVESKEVATVSITVHAVADTPILTVTTPVSGKENEDINLSIGASTPDDDGSETLSFNISTEALGAKLKLNKIEIDPDSITTTIKSWTLGPQQLSNLTITPPGPNSFTLLVTATSTELSNNDTAPSLPQTITVNVSIQVIDKPPVAEDDPNITTAEDTPKFIELKALDEEPELLTYTVVANPVNGTLYYSNTDPNLIYSGSTDPNLIYSSSTDPNLIYSPREDYNGTDSFTFKVKDVHDEYSNIATVRITITPVNDEPVANDDLNDPNLTTDEDHNIDITTAFLIGNDTDPDLSDNLTDPNLLDVLTITNVEPDPNITGKVEFDKSNGIVKYDPRGYFDWLAVGETAYDKFQYTLSDGHVGSEDTATVTVTVTGLNDAPVAIDGDPNKIKTNEDNDKDITTLIKENYAYDPDESDELTITNAYSNPNTIGDVTYYDSNHTVTYDPNGKFDYLAVNETATDSFTCTLSDGHGGEVTTTDVTVTVWGLNDAPVAKNDAYIAYEGIDLNVSDPNKGVLHNDNDAENDPLTATREKVAFRGEVTVNPDGSFTYTPYDSFYYGNDNFEYKVCDKEGACDTATVNIDIEDVPDEADLKIEKVADRYCVKEGEKIKYTITITNNGPHNAYGVEVTDKLPTGLTCPGIDPNQEADYTVTNNEIIWKVDSLANKKSAMLEITAQVYGSPDDECEDFKYRTKNKSTKSRFKQSTHISETLTSSRWLSNAQAFNLYTYFYPNSLSYMTYNLYHGNRIIDLYNSASFFLPPFVNAWANLMNTPEYSSGHIFHFEDQFLWPLPDPIGDLLYNFVSFWPSCNCYPSISTTIDNTAKITASDPSDPDKNNNTATRRITVCLNLYFNYWGQLAQLQLKKNPYPFINYSFMGYPPAFNYFSYYNYNTGYSLNKDNVYPNYLGYYPITPFK